MLELIILNSYLVSGHNPDQKNPRLYSGMVEGNEKSILVDLVHQRKKRDTANTILRRVNEAKLSQPGR